MSLNSLRLYKNTLLKCILALILCALVFQPVTSYSATGGGGSTRGGGAGNRTFAENLSQLAGFKGSFKFHPSGKLESYTTSSDYYSAYLRVDKNNWTKTASEASVKAINVLAKSNQPYWLTYYEYTGQSWNYLSTTPIFTNATAPELPSRTTMVIISSKLPGNYTVSWIKGANTSEEAQSVEYPDNGSLVKWGNIFNEYTEIYNGKLRYTARNEYSSSTLYWQANYGDDIWFKNNDANSQSIAINFYDGEFNYLGTQSTGIIGGQTWTVPNPFVGSYYVRAQHGSYLSRLKKIESNLGSYEIFSGEYIPTGTATGHFEYSQSAINKNSNITVGDGSTLVIVDGNGNNVTISPPQIVLTPVEEQKEDVTNYPPGSGPGEGDNNDDDKPWYEKLFDFFGGIFDGTGKLLGAILDGLSVVIDGITDILLLPINFIVNTLKDVLELLQSTLASLGGLAEFFGQVFFFLPSPLPQMLTLFIPAILVVAIVKMFL